MRTVNKISDEQAIDAYREKERQLARIGRLRRLRRSTHFQPAMALAVGTFFVTYIAYHWLLSLFWRPVIGVPETLALVTAFGAYCAQKYKTYDDAIFAVLTAYRPVDTAAYLELQERVSKNRILSDADLHTWLRRELEAIDLKRPLVGGNTPVDKKNDNSPRARFLNVKFGPSTTVSSDKDGPR